MAGVESESESFKVATRVGLESASNTSASELADGKTIFRTSFRFQCGGGRRVDGRSARPSAAAALPVGDQRVRGKRQDQVQRGPLHRKPAALPAQRLARCVLRSGMHLHRTGAGR